MNYFLIIYLVSALITVGMGVSYNYHEYKYETTQHYELTISKILNWMLAASLPLFNTVLVLICIIGMIEDWVEEKRIFTRPLIFRPAAYDYNTANTNNIKIEGNKILTAEEWAKLPYEEKYPDDKLRDKK